MTGIMLGISTGSINNKWDNSIYGLDFYDYLIVGLKQD